MTLDQHVDSSLVRTSDIDQHMPKVKSRLAGPTCCPCLVRFNETNIHSVIAWYSRDKRTKTKSHLPIKAIGLKTANSRYTVLYHPLNMNTSSSLTAPLQYSTHIYKPSKSSNLLPHNPQLKHQEQLPQTQLQQTNTTNYPQQTMNHEEEEDEYYPPRAVPFTGYGRPYSLAFNNQGPERYYSHGMGTNDRFYGRLFQDDRNDAGYSYTMEQGPRGRPAPYNLQHARYYARRRRRN
jgi:hypothetical protein